jgi:hypothetical protein
MTQQNFIQAIKSLKKQYRLDENYAQALSKALGFEEFKMYNNEILVRSMVDMLSSHFQQSSRAKDMLFFYMYDDNFGSSKDAGFNTEKDLWDCLVLECKVRRPHAESMHKIQRNATDVFTNIVNLTQMYKKSVMGNGSDSENQNILSAIDINLDYLRGLIEHRYDPKYMQEIKASPQDISDNDNCITNSDADTYNLDSSISIEQEEKITNIWKEREQ